jgi:hypothetical protein
MRWKVSKNDRQRLKRLSQYSRVDHEATLYCSEDDKEEWYQEVEEQGYRSRSAYLYELIQEARAYREQGFLAHHESEEKIEELKQKIEHLENRLENQEQQSSGRTTVDDVDLDRGELSDLRMDLTSGQESQDITISTEGGKYLEVSFVAIYW